MKFVSKKAAFPPLGLITVAAMLPVEWEKKLIDMSIKYLKDEDLVWADYVFISAMSIQRESVKTIIARCKKMGVKMVAGGPLFTAWSEQFDDVDYLVLNEAEITLPLFLEDLEKGQTKHIYTSTEWADIKKSPVPLWELIDMSKYASMNIQYSRGCPFNCEFCDIITLFGRAPRIKDKEQILLELEALYSAGWRQSVFFVDDNFIGNKEIIKNEVLPALIDWMEKKGYPFNFLTESSINLADDEKLMNLMVKAGFNMVFIGIESPNEESLIECNKYQNKNRDLLACINKCQRAGLEVQGGFIVGFDNDPDSIFETLIKFIQESGVITAMVGLLNAPRGTKLYQRLTKEGRILNGMTGDNTDFSINFIPKMDHKLLIEGYTKVLGTIYEPKYYYARVMRFFKEYNTMQQRTKVNMNFSNLIALFKSIFRLGIIGKERVYYWRLFFWTLFKRPRLFPLAITYSIYGYHFRKIFERETLYAR
ncbi:B12-binding domain-containing radical SAM protein [Anaerobacterium chartisolvens]|uniref:B12-binding domain-containing radical SAM protein n=1 Tax=Anaerobacterium chartisolvens TaxID=1297424 RepID=UPI003119CE74